MVVILDLSCFYEASKATFSILHVTAASVTVKGEWAIGRMHTEVTSKHFHDVMKLMTFIYDSILGKEKRYVYLQRMAFVL